MFKRIVIQLKGPICRCKRENLAWKTLEETLIIFCRTCKTEVKVGYEQFIAAFQFDQPYPEDRQQNKKVGSENDTPSQAKLGSFFRNLEDQMKKLDE
ncbi:MAG: hypothetical protein HY506_00855 [Candidatus Yanofskybacteria bacterium]|nr:hypothetical protein [Candidatus Yanofskybacteria bacterium]